MFELHVEFLADFASQIVDIPLHKMLRRKPTRIELKRDDLEEYEKAKELWSKENETLNKSKIDESEQTPISNVLTESERIARVQERIGYIKPDVVPSDGTSHFL